MYQALLFSLFLVRVFSDEEYACVHAATIGQDNIASEIDKHEASLILFYAPWCGHCKRLMPDFDKVCKDIKDTFQEKVLCGRVDCTTNQDLCKEHDLQGYPTLKAIHKNKQVCEYQGPRVGDRIYSWMKSVYLSTDVIKTAADLKKLLEETSQVLVSYLSAESKLGQVASTISCKMDSATLANVRDAEIAKSVGISEIDTFTLFKDGKLSKKLPTVENSEDLLKHIFFAVNDILPDYKQETAPSIFSPSISHYLSFVYDGKDNLLEHADKFLQFAEARAPQLRVFTLDSSDPATQNVVSFFHLKQFPAVVFYNDQTGKFHHFDGKDYSIENLGEFVEGCLAGSIPPYIKKQAVPEDWDKESVKVLVVDNFPEVFKLYPEGGMVLFYAPWCGHCEQFLPVWKQFGDYVAENHKGFFIGKVDHTENEIEGVEVSGYPTVIAFTSATEKTPYSGGRTLDELKKFFVDKFVEKKVIESEPEQAKPEHTEL